MHRRTENELSRKLQQQQQQGKKLEKVLQAKRITGQIEKFSRTWRSRQGIIFQEFFYQGKENTKHSTQEIKREYTH